MHTMEKNRDGSIMNKNERREQKDAAIWQLIAAVNKLTIAVNELQSSKSPLSLSEAIGRLENVGIKLNSSHVRTCTECATVIYYQDCPTGGWWYHIKKPNDGHDARAFGGYVPASGTDENGKIVYDEMGVYRGEF